MANICRSEPRYDFFVLKIQTSEAGSSFVTRNADGSNGIPASVVRPERHTTESVLPLPEEMSAREETEQLRKPKAAVAVAAVMGLLIIVLLLASHGTQDDGDRRSRPIEKPSTSQQ